MRRIDGIVIHCSAATLAQAKTQTAADIVKMHKARGWRTIGYHYFIRLDGTLEVGRPESSVGAHVEGGNANTIGVCYAGGLDANGKPSDTRTLQQRTAMEGLVLVLKVKHRGAWVKGHRDLSPDKDRDGKVEPHEWLKQCPCFDAQAWAATLGRIG